MSSPWPSHLMGQHCYWCNNSNVVLQRAESPPAEYTLGFQGQGKPCASTQHGQTWWCGLRGGNVRLSSKTCANLVFKVCAKWPYLPEKILLGEILGQILFSFISLQTRSIFTGTRNVTSGLHKGNESGTWPENTPSSLLQLLLAKPSLKLNYILL